MLVAIVNSPKTGADTSKPAMWIDGNIHGNEIQAGEVVLYTLWYLTRGYGQIEQITKLVDSYSFYLLPIVNPDGRQYWFDHPNTPHSSRQNKRPQDHDRDGKNWEDGPEDLDGDGKADIAVFRPSAGAWYAIRSFDNTLMSIGFGLNGDLPQPADFDADGKAEIGVFRLEPQRHRDTEDSQRKIERIYEGHEGTQSRPEKSHAKAQRR